jgi:hypothetical protein
VTFVGGGGSGATATAILNQGSVSQIVVLTAGSGYTNALAVVVDPPPVITQSQATALASVLNGFVVSVTVTDGGSGYSLVPNVAFTGGGPPVDFLPFLPKQVSTPVSKSPSHPAG